MANDPTNETATKVEKPPKAKASPTAAKAAPAADKAAATKAPANAKAARREQPSVKELLDQQRNFFAQHRGAVVTVPHKFHHPISERLYRRNFDQMSQYLYFIPVFGRILIEKEEEVLKIEEHVKNSIVKHTAALQKLQRECDVTYAQASLVAPTEFPNGYPAEVKMTSPLSRMFYELFVTADMFLMTMTDLWVRGMLDEDYALNEKKRNDFELDVKRMINTVMGTITRQHRAILNRIRGTQRASSEQAGPAAATTEHAESAVIASDEIEHIEDTPAEPQVAENAKAA